MGEGSAGLGWWRVAIKAQEKEEGVEKRRWRKRGGGERKMEGGKRGEGSNLTGSR